jgi:hypothetical protein
MGKDEVVPGTQVYWPDYGKGEIAGVSPGLILIHWEKAGSLWHFPEFVTRLLSQSGS